jgi:hypothetical protein
MTNLCVFEEGGTTQTYPTITKLQRKPFRWGCAIASLAMVLDVPAEQLVREIGHDGSQIVWEGLPEPLCRRGFNPQELIDCCLNRGLAVTEIQAFPVFDCPGRLPQVQRLTVLFGAEPLENWKRFTSHIASSCGILFGRGLHCEHAVAYDLGEIYDPDGSIFEFSPSACDAKGFNPHTLLRIDRSRA